jgi:hypothetical protein
MNILLSKLVQFATFRKYVLSTATGTLQVGTERT